MKRTIAAKVHRPVHLLGWILGALFAVTLLLGCGGKEEGIEVVVLIDSNGTAVPDVVNDAYLDSYITPSEIKIGLKSVQLIKAGETTSYTIFTKSDTDPLVLDLTVTPQFAEINHAFPTGCPCEFSKAQIELTFFDIQIPVYENGISIDHRVRFYTLDLTDPNLAAPVKVADVLIGNTTSTPNFNWVNTANGIFVALADPRPTNSTFLQVPTALFPGNVYSSIVTIDFASFFTIPEKPKGIFTVTLTVHTGSMFFYDDTDGNGQFDLSTDGKLNGINPNSHYYPTFPTITATGG